MKWIEKLWTKWFTSCKEPDAPAILFTLIDGVVEFDVFGDHEGLGHIMGYLGSKNGIDELLLSMSQLKCYKNPTNAQKFILGFGTRHKEEITPESAFLFMESKSINV